MIIFCPAYDLSTRANLTIAQLIATSTSLDLFGDRAKRDALIEALSKTDRPLLAFYHGTSEILYAQNGEIGLSTDRIHLLARRSVYAFACHTANRLGKSAADGGSIWWGYAGWISNEIDSPDVYLIFCKIFVFIRDNFSQNTSAQDRQNLLDELKQMCQTATDEINWLYSETENPDFNILEVNLTLLHLWDRLRVWVPGAEEAEKHPDASTDFFHWD